MEVSTTVTESLYLREVPQDPHSHEEQEDRVETSILWMTAVFLEILGAHRVLSYKPKDRHKHFSLAFQMQQMQQIGEFCTAEREWFSSMTYF